MQKELAEVRRAVKAFVEGDPLFLARYTEKAGTGTIEDEWIDTVETIEEMMDEYIHLRKKARDVFKMRYQETILTD